ncbi:uncharacterized protein LAJ45_07221 [Morchella importuna]|uniref:uncharacterized protein n=1 Tax=Morchella importuna TaxID=1174673 RepID=UPI001E8E6EBB|nr:uncharacterized protein LAJ45_07221 [Morchella importuna]KAH8148877.1 hypothetical protein LAJ45_07221 [Morchella importuna]
MSSTPVEPLWSAGIEEGQKEEARKLLGDGRWALSATRMGLERKFEFKTFKTTMVFINQVADQCKVARHHPEWANVYNKVVIRWTTHNPLGLSHKDIEMAKFCDERGAELGDVDTGKVERAPADETGGNVLDNLLGQGVQECGPCAQKSKK